MKIRDKLFYDHDIHEGHCYWPNRSPDDIMNIIYWKLVVRKNGYIASQSYLLTFWLIIDELKEDYKKLIQEFNNEL